MKKIKNYLRSIFGTQQAEVSKKAARKMRKAKKNKYEVIFAALLVIKHPTVVLPLSNKWLVRISQLTDVYDRMLANVGGYFTPGPTTPTLIAFKALLDSLVQLQQDVVEKKQDAKVNRDAKWEQILVAIKNLTAYVQIIVRAQPIHASQIVTESAMQLKIVKGKIPQGDSAISKTASSVEISGQVKATRQCNDWQICLNPSIESNWLLIKVKPTLAAKTTITGLNSDTFYYVRHMAIYKDGPDEWSLPIKVKVK